jgi:hypothetical protein
MSGTVTPLRAQPKRGLGRPGKGGYRLANGQRVPSVTTVTGHIKGEGLIRWAYQQGLDGVELYERRDEAARAGAIAHKWIEDFFHGDPPTKFDLAAKEDVRAAKQGFAAFKEWVTPLDLTMIETETPLVSEKHRYGGTLDAVALISGEPLLFDWKTSNSTYPDYIAQVAAYRELLRERDGENAPRRAYLLRVGKDYADFHFHSWPEIVLDLGWEWFSAAFVLYKLNKDLAKVAR